MANAQLSLDELAKAILSLKSALDLYHQAQDDKSEAKKAFRDACIQRFEYCIELAWKTSMKILGSTTFAAKPAIREMARNNLIDDPELWLKFIDSRNDTSHSYDENIALKVFKSIELFYPQVVQLHKTLKSNS